MNRTRPSIRPWVLFALLCTCACDELGNPAIRHGRTAPTTWSARGVELVTSSQTFPSENATDVLRSLPRNHLQQSDPFPPAGGTVTLVAVELTTPRRALPYTLRLLTTLRMPDGRLLQRQWQTSGPETTFYAAVLVPQSPAAAITRLR